MRVVQKAPPVKWSNLVSYSARRLGVETVFKLVETPNWGVVPMQLLRAASLTSVVPRQPPRPRAPFLSTGSATKRGPLHAHFASLKRNKESPQLIIASALLSSFRKFLTSCTTSVHQGSSLLLTFNRERRNVLLSRSTIVST